MTKAINGYENAHSHFFRGFIGTVCKHMQDRALPPGLGVQFSTFDGRGWIVFKGNHLIKYSILLLLTGLSKLLKPPQPLQ